MSDGEQPNPKPLMLRPWMPWLLGTVAAIQAWAFVENVAERDWILAGCFGLGTLAFVVQIISLWWLRRRGNRYPAGKDAAADRRP